MKNLLFNGCSYVAGDDIGWDYEKYGSIHDEKNHELWNQHKENRKSFNMSAKCASLLGVDAVDLSLDGNCNYNIITTTINYVKSLTEEEKNNLHVCIGWTEPMRFFYFHDTANRFHTVNPQHMLLKKTRCLENDFWDDVREKIGEYCLAEVRYKKDIDYALKYISEFSWLENFLKANKITYTFWRSLGHRMGNHDDQHLRYILDIDNLSKFENWISFDRNLCPDPWLGQSWRSYINVSGEPLSKDDHPSEISVNNFTVRLCENICQQLLKV
jgi:hypothetical protein